MAKDVPDAAEYRRAVEETLLQGEVLEAAFISDYPIGEVVGRPDVGAPRLARQNVDEILSDGWHARPPNARMLNASGELKLVRPVSQSFQA